MKYFQTHKSWRSLNKELAIYTTSGRAKLAGDIFEKIRSEQKESMKLSFSVDRKDPNCGMRFVSAYSPVNTNRFGHSQSWKYKKEKKRSYYW